MFSKRYARLLMGNKIAVIGTINKDTIHLPDGHIHHSYGGILYSLISLGQICRHDDEIYPIVNLGRDCRSSIMRFIKPYPNIKTDYINTVPEKNNHCHLYYQDQQNKTEVLMGGVPSLRLRDIKPALNCDLVMVNFISGRDVGLRALEKFRADYTGTIYIDIHSLTLGLKTNGGRFLRKPANWKRYADCADYLQMNAREYQLLTGLTPILLTLRLFPDLKKRKAVMVTLGSKGTLAGYNTRSGPGYKSFAVPKAKQPVDTTGCGDVFGAAFVALILKGYSLKASIKFANLQASRNSLFSGIENIRLDTLPST